MVRATCGLAAVVLVLGILVESAYAQLDGSPVYAINTGAGATVTAEFGGGVNAGSGKANLLGGRLILGVPVASFWIGMGRVDMRGSDPSVDDKEITFGGGAAFELINAPTSPMALSLQVGGGTVSSGSNLGVLHLTAGPALKVQLRIPGVGVEPWVMPRVHVNRRSEFDETVTRTGVGASMGLKIGLPIGLGLHAALDVVKLPTGVSGMLTAPEATSVTAGIGLHYEFAVPGLGLPLVPVVN
jgi:hypothetical protein